MAIPFPTGGIVPAEDAVLDEVRSLTRRAFISAMIVQIYYATPTLFMLLGGAQRAAGGLAQITVPVQGNSMVAGSWVGYGGSYGQPQVIPGVQNAQFNLSYYAVPIPLVMGEAMLQSTEAIIPIMDARINDVYAVTVQQMSQALFSNNTANPLMPSSFIDAFDNGLTVPTYGGITRTQAGNSFWASTTLTGAGGNLTRSAFSTYGIQASKNAGGEQQDFVVMSPNDYAGLNANFVGVEQIRVTPSRSYGGEDADIRSAFPNLNINGVPHFLDQNCPVGTVFWVNSKYFAMFVSESAQWDLSPFYSLIPLGQIAKVAVCLTGYNVICTKPVSGMQVQGFTGQPF